VQGLLVEPTSWTICSLIVDTSHWWLGHQVLVASRWIQESRRLDAKASLSMVLPGNA
jgi:hypothetical protein